MSFKLRQYQCKKCGQKYPYSYYKWCKTCDLKNVTKWASGNKKIDALVQEMQLKINSPYIVVFEWIPYNQFDDIKEISKGDFATVYSAIWKDGPLLYNSYKQEYTRTTDKKVVLKCLYNSHNITNEFLDEV